MDMEIIDTVPASTLEVGDTVRFDGEDFNRGDLEEISKVSENEEGELILFLEDSGETPIHPDLMVNIYGYTD